MIGSLPRPVRCARRFGTLLVSLTGLFVAASCAGGAVAGRPNPETREWIQLFNGRNLDGWKPKFTGHDLGVNLNNTVRVEDGLLKVRYDRWTGWNGEFGHIFYERRFSHYVIAAEYRFVGGQVPGAPPSLAWAIRNNGLMLHSQSPESMGKNQDFPISMEIQLLGGLGNGRPRSTANLCTPGTRVVMNDSLINRHCINSSSKTYDGDQWVRVEVLVLGDSIVKHIVNGDTVMTYSKPQMGGGNVSNLNPGVMVEGKPLTEGYITFQAETAEIDFRKIELLNLEGCTDPRASNYRTYFVKANNSMCTRSTGE